jgi:aspartate ammonia-lyase
MIIAILLTNSYALMISTLLLPSKVLKGIGCNRKKCAKEVDSSIDVGNYVVNKV